MANGGAQLMRELYRLIAYLKPYTAYAVLAPLLMLCEVMLDLMQPQFVQFIIDEGVAKNDVGVIVRTGLLMTGTALIAMCCGGGCTYFAVRAGYRMGGDLRGAVFRTIQRLPFTHLDRLETGALITRMTSDVGQVQEMVMMTLRGMVRMPLLLLGSVLMAVWLNVRLALIFFVILPVVVAALVLIVRRTFPLYLQVQTRLDALNTVLQENLAGVRVVKAFARAPHERERFARANTALIESSTAAVRAGARASPVMMLTLNSGVVATLWFGGHQVYAGDMRVGQVIAFINYLVQALNALLLFSNLVVQLSRAQASARRVRELLETDLPMERVPTGRTVPSADRGARVVFENVTFKHERSSRAQLRDVSFAAEPGQTVAILGATGAGKSSLVQLIPRFYDVSQGRVTIDGVDIRDIPYPELRELVSIALQESVLFSETIGNNIAFGKPGAEADEVAESARTAQADDFIRRRPESYETLVGQRGVNLSGGQKQRLAIARALLPKPRVLILDDSTSAVDVHTEARIQDALAVSTQEQTRIIVAQRISSVTKADRIIVLDDGSIVGDGQHAELLGQCPLYREIYESQVNHGGALSGQH